MDVNNLLGSLNNITEKINEMADGVTKSKSNYDGKADVRGIDGLGIINTSNDKATVESPVSTAVLTDTTVAELPTSDEVVITSEEIDTSSSNVGINLDKPEI